VTVRELQELPYLERAIRTERERLADLYAAAGIRSPGFSTDPRAPGAKDRIGALVPEIIDQEAAILTAIEAYEDKRRRLNAYINGVRNARMRTILIQRFVNQRSWQEVAAEVGDNETEGSVKMACYRFVEGRDEPAWMSNQISMFDEG
jgi:hypothetical protein